MDLSAVEAFINKVRPVQQRVGTILSFSGTTVSVIVKGSAQPITCQISSNLVAAPGDKCFIQRDIQDSSEWIITNTFSNKRSGIPSNASLVPQHAIGAVRPKNVLYYTDSFATVAINTTAYEIAYSLTVPTHSETLLIYFQGTARLTNTVTVESALHLTINMDDVDVSRTGTPIDIHRSRVTLSDCDIALLFPVKAVSPGIHQFDIMGKCSVVTNTTVYTITPASMWIMEM